MKSSKETKNIVLAGLGMATVFVATMFIKIPNAIDGYFNLGDGFILLFASILNPFLSFMVGGVGSALADVAGGYAYYFFPTLIIKGLEAVVVSKIMMKYRESNANDHKLQLLAYLLGAFIMVIGYFFTKWYMKGNVYVAAAGILENIFQAGAGVLIALVVFPIINKAFNRVK